MIDSLSTSPDSSETLIGGWKFDRPILEWMWRLVSLGFPDFLLEVYKAVSTICQDIRVPNISSRVNFDPTEFPQKPVGDMAVTRNDAYVLSLVMVLRIMHKFLMLDDLFARWQLHSAVADNALFIGDTIASHIPPGTILSLISADQFLPSLMKTMLATFQRVMPSNFTSVSTSYSLVEHSMLLIFGILQTVDNPIDTLRSFPDFYRWIRSCLLRVPAKEIRKGAARRMLECLTLMLLKCRDAREYSSKDIDIRINFFHYFFFSVLKSTHPGFDGSLGGLKPLVLREGIASPTLATPEKRESYTFLGPENYRNGEELYNLIAGLLTLRSRPEILNAIKIGSFEDICKSPDTLNPDIPWTKEEDLCYLFVEKLFTHRSIETFHSSISDGTLIGLLRTLIVLVYTSMECQSLLGKVRFPSSLIAPNEPISYLGLIPFLYFNCLFPQSYSSANPSRMTSVVGLCQTPLTRQLVYALLLNLCGSNKENLARLVEVLTSSSAPPSPNLPRRKVRRRLWEYDPSTLVKPSGASLGLVNQGATCYMNSFLQQLYHTKCFSNHLLEIDCDPSDSDNASVLFELQVLFGYLRFSQKNYCDTLSFCKAFKDYDGEPVKLGEQKDVNEFAAMLFEKLETNSDCKSLLQRCFGGKLVWQILSTESTYRSEREEPFFMLTAEVKDKTSLEDSLELYVAGEMLSGDNKIEDSTGTKVDALRRCAIRTLPEILIIHLKRFEFDLETMNRLKINDFFSFPDELNMFPYTERGIQQTEERRKARTDTADALEGEDMGIVDEGSPESKIAQHDNEDDDFAKLNGAIGDSQYRYRLKGIVAHTGAIDSGHYYSFIRNEGENTWMEYNDSSVLCFEAESIPGECFGGFQKRPVGLLGAPTMKQYNAYILVYERIAESQSPHQQSPRRKHQDLSPKSELPSNIAEDGAVVASDTPTRDRSASMLVDCEDNILQNGRNMTLGGKSGPISDRVMQAVWSENTAFLMDRTRFNLEYILFYWKLLDLPLIVNLQEEITAYEEAGISEAGGSHHAPLSMTILSHLTLTCFEFCVEILARARAQQCLPHFVEKLEDIVMHDLSGSSAEFILTALARDPPFASVVSAPNQSPISSPDRDISSSSHFSFNRLEDRDVVSKVDQLLITIFVDCPHVFTTSIFSRLLMWCIKILRRKHCSAYLSMFPAENGFPVDAAIEPLDDATPVQIHRQNEVKMESCKQYRSCVTRFIGKLLMIIDYYQPEDLIEHRGNESLSDLLMRFACLGIEEKNVLINFGSIYRYA